MTVIFLAEIGMYAASKVNFPPSKLTGSSNVNAENKPSNTYMSRLFPANGHYSNTSRCPVSNILYLFQKIQML